jgi:hypothetical protein
MTAPLHAHLCGTVCPLGFFLCKCCKRQLPLAALCPSRPNTCHKDNCSYKALAQRWSKNRQLKAWWETLSDDLKVAWYQKQQALPQGTKRSFDEIIYEETTITDQSTNEKDLDALVPWSVFLRNKTVEGMQKHDIELEWTRLTTSPDTEAVFRRGQWLVPEWQGLLRENETRHTQRTNAIRRAHVSTSEQLASLQTGGSSLLQQYKDSYSPPQQQYAQAPVSDASVSDQPVSASPNDIMMQQIHREVVLTY